MTAMHNLPHSTPSPPSLQIPNLLATCAVSRIEALKKELRVGLGKELFAKTYAVLEGGLDTEHEGVSVSAGASLSFLVNIVWVLIVVSLHRQDVLVAMYDVCM